jgi:hypothetical protein
VYVDGIPFQHTPNKVKQMFRSTQSQTESFFLSEDGASISFQHYFDNDNIQAENSSRNDS